MPDLTADEPFADRTHKYNGLEYRSGEKCIEQGCENPAGTAWSPHWCQPCNATRLRSIKKNLSEILRGFDA